MAAVETGMAAVAGSALGWAGYGMGRHILAATLTFDGGHFYLDDVVVSGWHQLLVLVGIPVLATLTSIAALTRVQNDPLGLHRRALRSPPTARHALPLVIGIGGQLATAPLREVLGDDTVDRLAPLLAITTIVGVVMIGPWLCLLAGRGLARCSRRAPGLLASRRIAGDPRATFRVVSGVVLAAFTVTYSASLDEPSGDRPYDGGLGVLRPGVVEVSTGGVPDAQVAPLLTDQVVTIRARPGSSNVVDSCADLARVVVLSCSAGGLPRGYAAQPGAGMAITQLLIPTDGTPAAENLVRTRAANLVPNAIIHTQQDRRDVDALFISGLGQLLRLAWQFVLVVAACSLTVSMIAGIIERRRPFALLRASGLRLGELRQVVLLETAAAMLVTTVLGVIFGMAASYVTAQLSDITWTWPDVGVLAMVGVGIVTALLLSLLALPLLDATTRHDAVRYE